MISGVKDLAELVAKLPSEERVEFERAYSPRKVVEINVVDRDYVDKVKLIKIIRVLLLIPLRAAKLLAEDMLSRDHNCSSQWVNVTTQTHLDRINNMYNSMNCNGITISISDQV